MRRLVLAPLLAAGFLACLPFSSADSLSKTYEFKEGITLELGTRTDDGLRLDNVRFQLPAVVEGRSSRTGGLAGALVDSPLGASVQAIYYCPTCEKETEKRTHGCGTPTRQERGWRWLNNDMVNFFSSLIGALVAAGLFPLA